MASPYRYTSVDHLVTHALDGRHEGGGGKGHETAHCLAHVGAWSAGRASYSLKAQLAAYDSMVDVPALVTHPPPLDADTKPGEARFKLKMVRQHCTVPICVPLLCCPEASQTPAMEAMTTSWT
jgi:hypothetical protein